MKEFVFHEEYAEIAQILMGLNESLKDKESVCRNREEIMRLNKKAIDRIIKLLDKMYIDNSGEEG